MKERPPGPGRRNRGRRLASSTPADGKGWAGAARPGAGHPRLDDPSPQLASSGGEAAASERARDSWPGRCSRLRRLVAVRGPRLCVRAGLSSGSLAPLAKALPDSCTTRHVCSADRMA